MIDFTDEIVDPVISEFINSHPEFDIDRLSQEGGNCDMFFGYHKIFERRIALKIYMGTEKYDSHHEPRILSKLNHANILRVRDAKRINADYSYFMTDEISGGDLEKFISHKQPDLKSSLRIIQDVLCGLTELHKDSVRILHRDIKPKNILVEEDPLNALIADFGSIKHFDIAKGSVSSSKTTLAYQPIESIESNEFTRQSDIHQVGVTLYQTLGGFFPDRYEGWLNEKELGKLNAISGGYEKTRFVDSVICKLIRKGQLISIDSLPPFINGQLRNIISKATHRQLHIRYKNTSSFMQALLKVQKDMVNWWVTNNEYHAETSKGERHRVIKHKKVWINEKRGSQGKWRRNGEPRIDVKDIFIKINKD